MTECELCSIAAGKEKSERVYEDNNFIAVLSQKPAALGHIILFPKKHYQIIEQIPDYAFGEMFNIANKLSIADFEAVKANGSNIIVQNGVAAGQDSAHVSVHIIPRNENDGLNFQWQPKQLNEEQMSTIEIMLKKEAKPIGDFEKKEKKEPIKIEKKIEKIEVGKDKEENYLIKQLMRVP